MEIITIFKAIDGVTFEDFDECKLYEYKITHVPEQLTFWAEDNKTVLEGDGTIEGVEEAYINARHMDVANFKGKIFDSWQEAIEFLDYYWGFVTDGIDKPGNYKYDEMYDHWKRIGEDEEDE